MRKILICLLITLFLTACTGQPAALGADAAPGSVPDLVGDYAINGVSPDGVAYGGTLTIKPGDTPGNYRIQWLVTGGIQEGTGVIDGNVLKVQWTSISSVAGETSGAGSFVVTVNGELYGNRTTNGVQGSAQETYYPNKKH